MYPVKTINAKMANPTDSISIPVIHEFSKNIQNQTSEMSKFNLRQEHLKSTTGEGLNTIEYVLNILDSQLFINTF